MGKVSRRAKTNKTQKPRLHGAERNQLIKLVLGKLAEQGLTLASAPELGPLLRQLGTYKNEGERMELSLALPGVRCRLHVMLPKYVSEKPILRVMPI